MNVTVMMTFYDPLRQVKTQISHTRKKRITVYVYIMFDP